MKQVYVAGLALAMIANVTFAGEPGKESSDNFPVTVTFESMVNISAPSGDITVSPDEWANNWQQGYETQPVSFCVYSNLPNHDYTVKVTGSKAIIPGNFPNYTYQAQLDSSDPNHDKTWFQYKVNFADQYGNSSDDFVNGQVLTTTTFKGSSTPSCTSNNADMWLTLRTNNEQAPYRGLYQDTLTVEVSAPA